jgi:hypothetical protein
MDAFDPRDRELCPDGACIGLIGADGRCKECGTVSPNAVADPRHQGMQPGAAPDAELADEDEDDDDYEEYDGCPDDDCPGEIGADGRCMECGKEAPADSGPDDFEARQLCSDDACIGLIGISGRCNACGKPAATSTV